MWEMAEVFDKLHKSMGNDLDTWEMAKIFGKWARSHRERFKYLRKCISMLEMTSIS